jgi:hypothetical protein
MTADKDVFVRRLIVAAILQGYGKPAAMYRVGIFRAAVDRCAGEWGEV